MQLIITTLAYGLWNVRITLTFSPSVILYENDDIFKGCCWSPPFLSIGRTTLCSLGGTWLRNSSYLFCRVFWCLDTTNKKQAKPHKSTPNMYNFTKRYMCAVKLTVKLSRNLQPHTAFKMTSMLRSLQFSYERLSHQVRSIHLRMLK